MKIITATDLKQWADTKSCQKELPYLVKELIKSFDIKFSEIRFPIGDSTYLEGFDGIINITEGNSVLPMGDYVFEMGCSKKIQNKANDDYEKRTKNPLNVTPEKTTYIFVTPREWGQKDRWVDEKRKENIWKDVKVWDAVTLEDFLEESEVLSIKFSKIIGKDFSGLKSLEVWWNEWKNFKEFEIDETILLSSRTDDKKEFLERLEGDNVISIKSLSPEESIAFVASVFKSLDNDVSERYFSKSIIIEDINTYKEIVSCRNDYIIIVNFEISNYDFNEKNKFILISDQNNHYLKDSIKLSQQFQINFDNALANLLNLSHDDVKVYTKKSGANILSLKRILTGLNNPNWSDYSEILVPLFLVKSWDNSNSYDKKIINELLTFSFDKFIRKITQLSYLNDSPVYKIDDVFTVRSHYDLFLFIKNDLTKQDLENLKKISTKILNGDYSYILKKGILETLILLSVFSKDLNFGFNLVKWVDSIIKEIFLNEDISFWNVNSKFLQLLAEASPNSFLDAFESQILNELHKNNEDVLNFVRNDSYLLWSLEKLVWNENHFPQVIQFICELYNFSDFSKFSPDYLNALYEIFLPWKQQTYASLEEKIIMIDRIIHHFPDLAWKLLIKLMPDDRMSSISIPKPIYRKSFNKYYSYEEIKRFYMQIIPKAIKFLDNDIAKCIEILDFYCFIDKNNKKNINKILLSFKENETYSLDLWDKIREILSINNPKSSDKLNLNEWEELYFIYLELKPISLIDSSIWLFDFWPKLLNFDILDDGYGEELNKNRRDVIINILNKFGFNGLKYLVIKVKNPKSIGEIIVQLNLNYDEEIIDELNNENENIQKFIGSYIFETSTLNNRLLNFIDEKWSLNTLVKFFSYLKLNRDILMLIEKYDEDFKEKFWRELTHYYFDDFFTHSYYLEKFLRFGYDNKALYFAYINFEKIDINLIYKMLFNINIDNIGDNNNIVKFLFDKLYVEDYNSEKMCDLEIKYYNVLSYGTDNYLKNFYKKLSEDSLYFSELIIKANNKSNDSLFELGDLYLILENFNVMPGMIDEKIDNNFFINWVNTSRSFCKENSCLELCDCFLGFLFANSEELNGFFPPKEVCSVIDDLNNSSLNSHFKIGVRNKRGVYGKRLTEGGNQELDLSKKYKNYSKKIKIEFPVTSKLLKDISDCYYEDSLREDKQPYLVELYY